MKKTLFGNPKEFIVNMKLHMARNISLKNIFISGCITILISCTLQQ